MSGPALDGKLIVVTGAGGGIGRHIVRACAQEGATVVAVHRSGSSSPDHGDPAPGRVVGMAADVTDPGSVADLAEAVAAERGGVHGVVATVGRRPPDRPFQELTPEEWSACLATNLDSAFLTFRAFAPALVEGGGGSLVGVSSIAARKGREGQAAYAAAKGGLVALVRALAVELGPAGVRVNAVTPGATRTERVDALVARMAEEQGVAPGEALRQLARGSATGRIAEPSEVAAACCFLLSDAAAGITGEDLNVSNGTVMY